MKPITLRSLSAAVLSVGLAAGAAGSAMASERTITWGKPAEITGFDVHVAGTVASWEFYQIVYETLLQTDEDLGLEGRLAESWEQTSPTTYEFVIRQGAKFSNGRAVHADDVIGSLARIKDPETASYWSPQLGDIESMEALDERTVRVELAQPHPAFLAALAHITAAIIPIAELEDGSYDPNSDLMGTGPFKVERHDQDEAWTFVRNPHYWRDGYPRADRLEVRITQDESARIAALRDGRVDFATFEDPDSPRTLGGYDNIDVAEQQTTNYYRLDVNALSEESPFHDRRVRQAMNLALDRDAINMLVFDGTTNVDYPVPDAFGKEACRGTDTYALPREERLEKARALLQEAGQPNPEVELMASSANQVLVRIAQVVQSSVNEAGFQVSIAQVPTAEYLQRVFTDGDFDFSASWLAGYTDPTMVIAWWNPEFAVWNQVFQESVPELNTALDEVKSMQDGPERDEKLVTICERIDEGANLISLVSKVDYMVYRNDQIEVNVPERSGSSNTYQFVAEFEPLD